MENIKDVEVVQDVRQSPEYAKYMESIGWKTVQISSTKQQSPNNIQNPILNIQLFIKKLGPVAIAKILRTKGELPMGEIEKILKQNRVVMVKIEPHESTQCAVLRDHKYKISNWPLQATKTIRISLKPNEEQIFSAFKKDCRYTLRKFIIYNLQFTINNFEQFYKIWRQSAKRKGLWIPGEKEYKNLINAFGKKCYCITINNIAGAVILTHQKTAFYFYAGSTHEGNKLNLPYLVVWEAMKMAKKKGCLVWDFEGVFDHRWPNKGWQGFSHFKHSFGGREIEFPGSYEKWRWPY